MAARDPEFPARSGTQPGPRKRMRRRPSRSAQVRFGLPPVFSGRGQAGRPRLQPGHLAAEAGGLAPVVGGVELFGIAAASIGGPSDGAGGGGVADQADGADARVFPFRLPRPQIVQPWWFGDPAFKATGLYTRGLPQLVPTHRLTAPKPGTEAHKAWSAIHRAPPGPDRWKVRSKTFAGMAEAWADQWGGYAVEVAA